MTKLLYQLAIIAIFLMSMISCENRSVEAIVETEGFSIVFDSLNIDLSSFDSLSVLPGFAVSVFKADTILFEKGYGYSNLEKKLPYTPESNQIIASATKTLVGVSLMRAVENRLLIPIIPMMSSLLEC